MKRQTVRLYVSVVYTQRIIVCARVSVEDHDAKMKQLIPNACYLVGIIKWVRSLENKEKDYIWLGAHM